MLKKTLVSISLLLVSLSTIASQHPPKLFWICVSDTDPRGIYINYSPRGVSHVQIGSIKNNFLATSEIGKEDKVEWEPQRETVRFNFDDDKQSLIIVTGGREVSPIKNLYSAGYFDFSVVGPGKVLLPIDYVCLSSVNN